MAENEKDPIADWCHRIIEGSGGMNQYEDREMVIWHVPDRVAAVMWAIRCLANPWCEGSAEVLQAIRERRKEVQA